MDRDARPVDVKPERSPSVVASRESPDPVPVRREPKLSSVYKEGDVQLVTSDNHELRVDHVYAAAMSTTIKNSWATRSDPSEALRITLTEDFEDKDTVRKVLDLATGRKPLRTFPTDDIDDWRGIYLFAQKWVCPQIIYTLRLYLTGLATSDSSSCDRVFILGAIMDDPALCALAIRSVGSDIWSTRPKKDLGTLYGMNILNPAGWGAAHFLLTPRIFIWALMRAMQEEEENGKRAARFLELIKKYKESPT